VEISSEFTPLASTIGGALIGLSASMLLLLEGRVAGISGIVGELFRPREGDIGWRVAFLVGMAIAGVGAVAVAPQLVAVTLDRHWALTLIAGLLVGFGTRLGNGCTSGHGVCGLSRMSPRSLVSVLTFMAVGATVATVVGLLTRGNA
jgi:uncharacterized membrane protein YedE/YeeE